MRKDWRHLEFLSTLEHDENYIPFVHAYVSIESQPASRIEICSVELELCLCLPERVLQRTGSMLLFLRGAVQRSWCHLL
jgi:hypothetical protein